MPMNNMNRIIIIFKCLLLLLTLMKAAYGCDITQEEQLTPCEIKIKLCKCRCKDLEVSESCIDKCDMKGDRCLDMELPSPNLAKLRKQPQN